MATKTKQATGVADGLLAELPVDRLKEEVIGLGKALAKRGVAKLGESLTGATGKLGELGDAVPGPGDVVKAATLAPVKGAASKVKDALPGTGSDGSDDAGDSGGKGKVASMDSTDLKVTNIVETIDVPVSRDVAYELWTQFEAFPAFMKKVEAVNQKKPEELTWKAQVFWSHRTWTAKIVDQVPPEHIVWKSEGQKGHVDGAVTFHELAPDLTRVLVSLEYFPQGLFERTGNLWRAQGRRVRLELKHFRRFVANHALLQQDEIDGWEGEIHDGKVKRRRTAKKSASGGSTAKKSTSGPTAKKSASSGSTAKKSASGSTAKKSASSGSTAKKSASGSTAKKSASSGSSARKTTARKTAAKKAPAKKAPAKRTAAAAKRSSTTTSRTSSAGGRSGTGARKKASAAKKTAPKTGRSGSSRSSRSKS
jgi:uncharacterized membrane protein